MTDAAPARDERAWVVDPEHAGDRVDVVLARLSGLSRSAAGREVDDDRVQLDGQAVRRSAKVDAGQVLTLAAPPPPPPVEVPRVPPIRWQDEHLLVIAKPAGLVVHAGVGHQGDTLVDALLAEGHDLAPSGGEDRPGIVHRLDRDTSGVLVVAKTDEARAGLAEQLRSRSMARHYLAMVEVGMPGPRGRVDAPLGRHPSDRTRFAVVEQGRHAVTHWRDLAIGTAGQDPVSLVACRLETGRTHQIRVHLSEAGAPVVGDLLYGAHGGPARALGLERLFLHAAHLGFDHPVTGERIEVVEPLPDDLHAAAEAAGIDPGLDARFDHESTAP